MNKQAYFRMMRVSPMLKRATLKVLELTTDKLIKKKKKKKKKSFLGLDSSLTSTAWGGLSGNIIGRLLGHIYSDEQNKMQNRNLGAIAGTLIGAGTGYLSDKVS